MSGFAFRTIWLGCLACLAFGGRACGAESRLEHGLPRDTVAYLHLPAAGAWVEDLDGTPLGAWLRQPDMRLFGQVLWEDRSALAMYLSGGSVPEMGLEAAPATRLLSLLELVAGDVTLAMTGPDGRTGRADLAAAITFAGGRDPVELLAAIGRIMPGLLRPADDAGGRFFRIGGERGIHVAFRREAMLLATRPEMLARLWRAYAEPIQDADCLARESVFRQARERVEARGNRIFLHINLNSLRATLASLGATELGTRLDRLGLGAADAVSLGGGATAGGFLRHTLYLSAPEPRAGWLRALGQGGDLSAATRNMPEGTDLFLAIAWGDAAAGRTEGTPAPQGWDVLAPWIGPDAAAALAGLVPALEPHAVLLHGSAQDPALRLMPPDGVLRFQVRDAAALEHGLSVLRRLGGEDERTLGTAPTIRYRNRFASPQAFSPAYAVEDDVLYVAASVQTLRGHLARDETRRDTDIRRDAERLLGRLPNVALLRLDTARSFAACHEAFVSASHMLAAVPGIAADGALLPPFRDIDAVWGETCAGIRVDRDGMALVVAGPAGALGLPAWLAGHAWSASSGGRNAVQGVVAGIAVSRAGVALQEAWDERNARARLRRIGLAIVSRQEAGKPFPRTLDDLVADGFLVPEDLHAARHGVERRFVLGDGAVVLAHESPAPGETRVLALYADGSIARASATRLAEDAATEEP